VFVGFGENFRYLVLPEVQGGIPEGVVEGLVGFKGDIYVAGLN